MSAFGQLWWDLWSKSSPPLPVRERVFLGTPYGGPAHFVSPDCDANVDSVFRSILRQRLLSLTGPMEN